MIDKIRALYARITGGDFTPTARPEEGMVMGYNKGFPETQEQMVNYLNCFGSVRIHQHANGKWTARLVIDNRSTITVAQREVWSAQDCDSFSDALRSLAIETQRVFPE